ncbi:Peptidase A4 family [Saccharolobus shibatae B12]|uniref:Uncharacterized protein A-291 n=2 Tax=root TaxID=1 RepID=A291_SSV1|nr:hypothetical protein [Saccharolobus shibatae]NP_039796.1 ORF A-291 [Sulfolobus spindle-shaped virus 1]P20197.1 RecName: Full=Uncharacterized protein A-291 [Sulfolobus spindle-shaped virus 1]QXJ30265.1 Peptidase A4 family [Saccharolobus shibatae B12]CAA30198.1 ORF A-291 [Sulfolobus spindle-shaped virus 1]
MRKSLLALLTLSLALLSFLITPSMALNSGGSPIPIYYNYYNYYSLNAEGFGFSFNNSNNWVETNFISITINLPSSLPNNYQINNAYSIVVGLSPYPVSNINIFNSPLEAYVELFSNPPNTYPNEIGFVVSYGSTVFYSYTTLYSSFAGTQLTITISYTGNGFGVQFSDSNGFSHSVSVSSVNFVPYGALILGSLIPNGNYYYYPVGNMLPNASVNFSYTISSFTIEGNPATSVDITTLGLEGNTAIYTSSSNWFKWVSGSVVITNAVAYTYTDLARIGGSAQINYTASQLY